MSKIIEIIYTSPPYLPNFSLSSINSCTLVLVHRYRRLADPHTTTQNFPEAPSQGQQKAFVKAQTS